MNKEEFIDSKMKLSKEDIIYDYYKCEEKLIEKIGIEHDNYELEQENKKQKEVIDKAIKNLEEGHSNWVILDILKEVSK